MTDRYQSSVTEPGAFPTVWWFAALMDGIDGPLGSVLDVGCAEGVMSVLAAEHGATSVLGIDHNPERIALCPPHERVEYRVAETTDIDEPFHTVILSMVAHWVGEAETRRLAALAERNVGVIFRAANDGYAPENGTWFPTIGELELGILTHERLLLTQDNGKQVWAATYRTDMHLYAAGSMVWKHRPGFDPTGLRALYFADAPLDGPAWDPGQGYGQPLINGRDLHGDAPFRPTHGRPVTLVPEVRDLARGIAKAALASGWYPTDFSPRNIIVNEDGAHLVDLDDIERHDGRVAERYLPIWQSVLPGFSGDFRELL